MSSLNTEKKLNCVGTDPEIFFPERSNSVDASVAIKICMGCDVRTDCLDEALTSPNGDFGIWGGATEAKRRAMKRRGTRLTS